MPEPRAAAPAGPVPPWKALAEPAVLAGLFVFHLASFELTSAVHGPWEIFAQDSVYILDSLAAGDPYPWNPQSHLLYHLLVEWGYGAWGLVFGTGLDSAYRFLKLFSALFALGFLVALREVLRQLGLGPARRVVLLLLAGLSVTVWFHGAAFETHVPALLAVAIYLRCLVRLRAHGPRTRGDRLLFVGALLFAGWTRVDLFRLALFTAPLPFLAAARRERGGLLVDLGLVALLGVAGNAAMASAYLGAAPARAPLAVLERHERPQLRALLGQPENLAPPHLLAVGRAASVYAFLMPVEARPPERSFLEPPDYTFELGDPDGEVNPSTGLFRAPARHLTEYALSLLALGGFLAWLGAAAASSVRRAAARDPLHLLLWSQIAGGAVLCAWFNPHEPFLWGVEFVPLWIVLLADAGRDWPAKAWWALGAATALMAAHNLFAFYLPFR